MEETKEQEALNEDQSVKPEDQPTIEWCEKEILELRAKVTELEFEKELLLIQLIKLTGNNPKNCY